jgi:hypothetical protein
MSLEEIQEQLIEKIKEDQTSVVDWSIFLSTNC